MKMIKSYFLIVFLIFLLFFMGCSTTVPTPSNQAPTINSTPPTGNLLFGEPYTYDVEATDLDGDTLTYSFISNPVGMTIISATGLINWTPTMFGNYNVSIEVSDGELSDIQSFTITVTVAEDVEKPTVYTDNAFSITKTGAYIKCGISNTGGELANMRGVEYRDVTAGGSIQSTGSSGNFDVGQWASQLTNLTSGHQYEARAYAKNSADTGYGLWIPFTTDN